MFFGYKDKDSPMIANLFLISMQPTRDKVFALLGLASHPLGIAADYSKEVEAVFIDVAVRILYYSENFDIICQSQWQPFKNLTWGPGLPNWVPDFSWP
jgi:hypothetical protein